MDINSNLHAAIQNPLPKPPIEKLPDSKEVKKENKFSQTNLLIKILDKISLFKDQNGNTYAEIQFDKTTHFCEIPSQELKDKLNDEYFKITKSLPAKTNVDLVIERAKFLAKTKGKLIDVKLRFCVNSDKIYIDTANENNEIICVTNNDWSIISGQNLPFKFRRNKLQQQLVTPIRNGDPKLFLKYVNIDDENLQMLLLVCLCAMPFENINRPIIGFMGPEGSAKTTAARLFRKVFDPCLPLENNVKMTQDDIALALYHNAIPLFDNLSSIPKSLSDIFCQAITGSAHAKRKLYSDSDMYTIYYHRPIIYTAIECPSSMLDLIDRQIPIDVNWISPFNRKEERIIIEGFNNDLPKILGGCLDVIVKALKIYPQIHIKEQPRLADFARIGAAIAEVLGYGKDKFIETYTSLSNQRKVDIASEGEPLLEVIIEYLNKNGKLFGTPTELVSILNKFTGNRNIKIKSWPNNSVAFGRKLRKLEGTLEGQGITVKRATSGTKPYTIEYKSAKFNDNIEVQNVRTVPPPPPPPPKIEIETNKVSSIQDCNEKEVCCRDCKYFSELSEHYECNASLIEKLIEDADEVHNCENFTKNSEDEKFHGEYQSVFT